MKCAAVFTFVSLAFVSQTFAVVRPLFPVKPEPPLSGGAIVIGDDLIQNPSKKFSAYHIPIIRGRSLIAALALANADLPHSKIGNLNRRG